jgi:hypothetical protein
VSRLSGNGSHLGRPLADAAKAAEVDHDCATATEERSTRSPSRHRLEHSGIHAGAFAPRHATPAGSRRWS